MAVHNHEQAREVVQNVLSEELITLPEATAELQKILGKRLSRATIHRWVQKGTRGRKLDAARVGNTYFTSRESINRFIVGLTAGN
jgi:hypothetical protein